MVHVRAGKQKRQREVPLHESTIGAPGEYARQRDARFPTPSTSAFFISARGRRMARQELNQTFTKLIREVGLDSRGSGRSISITHRHIKNNRLANVCWMWAFSASSTCEPARRHYRQRREHGDRHAAATRHLFNKLLGQLHH